MDESYDSVRQDSGESCLLFSWKWLIANPVSKDVDWFPQPSESFDPLGGYENLERAGKEVDFNETVVVSTYILTSIKVK